MADFNLLEWANVGLGKGNAYKLSISIKKLAETLPPEVKSIRFFGKVSTRSSPYYILEGSSPEDEEEADPSEREGRAGVNKYAYWVSHSVSASPEEWKKLPHATFAQLLTAQKFKRFLTGRLDAPVPSYPPFPGTEASLLRVIIAQIVGTTSISPDGYFEVDEDADEGAIKAVEPAALLEKGYKTAGELKEAEGWRHHELAINSLGRITPLPEPEEGAEPVEEPVEVSKPLSELKAEEWVIRTFQHEQATVVARSSVWPGALAVSSGQK